MKAINTVCVRACRLQKLCCKKQVNMDSNINPIISYSKVFIAVLGLVSYSKWIIFNELKQFYAASGGPCSDAYFIFGVLRVVVMWFYLASFFLYKYNTF